MSPLLAGLFIIFFGLVALRVPVAAALGLGALIGMIAADLDLLNMVSQLYRGLDVFTILAAPFFLTMGFIVNRTSIGIRLMRAAAVLVGWLPGSLGHINVVVSMLFAGLSGSATADTTGEGSVIIPMMRRRGYSPSYAAAITAITSTIGAIIPPSIIMIIYAAYASVSVSDLFLSGFLPGILLGIAYMVVNALYVRRTGVDTGFYGVEIEELGGADPPATAPIVGAAGGAGNVVLERSAVAMETDVKPVAPVITKLTPRLAARILAQALPPLLLPIIIIGGITGGAFTATEAGVIALVYLLFLVAVVYREIKVSQILPVLRDAVQFYSLPLLAAGMATVFAFVVTVLGAPDLVREFVVGLELPPFGYLIMVFVVLTVVGTFLDSIPVIVLFVPILVPGANALGIPPVQLGLIVTMTLALGLTLPPDGLCLLIAAKLAGVPVLQVARALLPFYLVTLAVIILVAVSPDFVLLLPRLVGGTG